MVSGSLNWPVLNENGWLFGACLAIALALALGLFFLSRMRRWGSVAAAGIAVVWVVLLLPDIHYYFVTQHLDPAEWIVEPFYREYYIRGYAVISLPVLFVLLGIFARPSRRTI
jgi:hypothetical protein